MNELIDAASAKAKADKRAAREELLDLLLSKGLYSSISLNDDNREHVEKIVRSGALGKFDHFCVTCKREMPFIMARMLMPNRGGGLQGAEPMPVENFIGMHGLRAVCQRSLTVYQYVLGEWDGKLIKIGQFPSTADIAFVELNNVVRALDAIDRKELGQAIGLFSHDAVIGAFVYLRRVFERMISRAYERFEEKNGPITEFDKKKMDQKIALLKSELPDSIVRNSQVFSVLSLGIHELSECKCKEIFPLMKALICQMLEAEEHQRQAARTQRETEAALQKLLSTGELKEG